jgi:hypothetical protein
MEGENYEDRLGKDTYGGHTLRLDTQMHLRRQDVGGTRN